MEEMQNQELSGGDEVMDQKKTGNLLLRFAGTEI